MARRAIATLVLGLAACAASAAPQVMLDRNGSHVSIETYAPNVVRVTISPDAKLAAAPAGYGFIGKPDDKGWTHDSSASGDTFRSARLVLEVAAQPKPGPMDTMARYFAPTLPPVTLKVRKPDGTLLLDMTGWEMSPHKVSGEETFRVGASFNAPADEHYYGLGQNQEGILDYRGRTVDCRHDYDAPAGETVCVPFMVSSKGYGIVWDNPSVTRITAGVNGRTMWQSNVGERVSFFIITGDHTDDIYAGYRTISGVTPLPPKAAFGFIQSKARYASQKELLDAAAGYRKRGYPLDVMVLDWFYWTKMGQLDIDPEYFPDPAAMNRTLHEQGMQSIISVWPRFERSSRYFDTLAAKGWLLKNDKGEPQDGLPFRSDRAGALIDSTNPQARDWFWGKIRDNIASQGFDWFWLDETEPDLVPDGYFYSIGSGDRYHNVFPLLHTQGVAEGSRRDRPNKRNLILSRAAYTGTQRNGALFWSSDIQPTWEVLKRQVPTGLNFTASGMAYWGNDIGGWQTLPAQHTPERKPLLDPSAARDVVGQYDDYPELLARWFQYGAFTPTLRVHGLRKQVEVWSYGEGAEGVMVKYLKLRYTLMPYLYAMGKHTYDTGAPFMRALYMDFPNDPQVSNLGDEYMFGPAFLVAPVTEQGVEHRDVYLPQGSDWINYWTGEKFTGGRHVTVAAPIDIIPLFVRAGSIIPMGVDIPSTATKQPLASIRVYPGKDADFTLYDDDGVTNDYEKGAGKSIRLHWDDKARKLTASDGSDLSRLVQVISPQ
ncbi:alpha-D-xyloside xylohydrolase [Luteibacter sp. Sphag1AF]|uniref:glycoside hydrolase family 31 protein n=1 Tax=Luteibacter sp. Sphag1AF TaxID=2587031 RepID=UPI0017EB0854|nr:glycoside hydrolase family 31 protein [Luteibacter sp. Sphag1AF]MBB3227613.1 alpha-D-xyloside xylohydrolase [Luteibacter sp. Sphag1AF]